MTLLDYAPPSRSFWAAIRYSPSWWLVLLRCVFAAAITVIGLVLVAGILFGASFSPFYAVLVSGICIGAMVRVLRELRQRWAGRVLFHIEAAVRTNLPISEYLNVASDSEGRFVRKRLLAVAELLQTGTPLAVALPSGAPELSSHESRLIYAGERTGRLPQMLARVVRGRSRESRAPQVSPIFLYRWYLPIAGLAMLLVAGAILTFVFPKFEVILRDYKLPQPWAMTLPRLFVDEYWWLGVLLILVPGVIWALVEVLRVIMPANPGLEKRRWRILLGSIPVLGQLHRSRSLADICWIVAADVRAGIPLSDSVREISDMPLDGDLNQRAARWRALLEAGGAPAESARRAGMPELICCILNAPGDAEGLAGSLETAGDLYEARHGRVLTLIEGITVPLVLLVLAGVVLMLALSIFVPIIQMIDHLAQMIGGKV